MNPMTEIQTWAEKSLNTLKQKNVDQAVCSASLTESQEFQVEANRMTLLRTTFDQSLSNSIVKDAKSGSGATNQFSDSAVNDLSNQVFSTAAISPADPAYGFAPNEGKKTFDVGNPEINKDWVMSKINELLEQTKAKYPKVIIEGCTLKFVKHHSTLVSSSGTQFSQRQCYYDGSAMFTSKDGNKSSSFNYTGFQIPSDSTKMAKVQLMQEGDLSELFRQSEEHLHVKKVPEKFTGDLLMTPHCMEHFLGYWLAYLRGMTLMKKESLFKDKLGSMVASNKLSLTSSPHDKTFSSHEYWTSDGYLTKDLEIFKNGQLQNYILGHYTANKLGMKPSCSSGSYLKMQSGDSNFQEMLSSIKKGILFCRFSGGNPADNGDFSGVAKNSYYIENGKIMYPVSETMVSGNLAELLKNIQAVSKETLNPGYSELPWVKFSGATVS